MCVMPRMSEGGRNLAVTRKGGGRGEPAASVGGGLNLWLGKHTALRFEARDYINNGAYIPGYQYLSFRVGVTFR